MKRIIICADDFGRTQDRNKAIDWAMRKKIVQSTGLLVGSEYTNEAIMLARNGGYIDHLHCHLNLISGLDAGYHLKPCSNEAKESRFLCENNEFITKGYYKLDYKKYINVVYTEIEKQYNNFVALTSGNGNYQHIDFHVYGNLSFPVAAAYGQLIRRYNIKTYRVHGEHQLYRKKTKQRIKIKLAYLLTDGKLKRERIKSCNADFYLSLNDLFRNDDLIEIYVHPDYINAQVMDNSKSYLGHKMVPLEAAIQAISESNNMIQYISWEDL